MKNKKKKLIVNAVVNIHNKINKPIIEQKNIRIILNNKMND